MRRLLTLLLLIAGLRAESVLVLPFANLSSSASLDWIGVSISQAIIDALADQGIRVVEAEEREEVYRRLSLRPYARLTRASIIKVAEALDATEIIYGEFELAAAEQSAAPGPSGVLRISAGLLDVNRMTRGPEFSEQGPVEDLAQLETHLAWRALHALAPHTTPPLEEFALGRPKVRVSAIESYTRGLLATSPEQKHRFFTQAVRLDENFSQPCFELGRFYWDKQDYRLAANWLARVKPSAPHFLECSFFLGLCRYYTADYAGAQAAFELVARAVPLTEVFNNLGAAQSRRNLPEALDNLRTALKEDPADPDYHFNVGFVLWKTGRFAEAADRFRAVLDRDPEDELATLMLGRCLKQTGPRRGDPRSEGLERLKHNYEERAWRQMKAALETKAPADNPLE